MKTLLTIALLAIALTGFGQTSTNVSNSTSNFVSGLGPQVDTVLGFLSAGTNFIVAPYGIYSTGSRSAGAGLALAYKASEFLVPMIRLDMLPTKDATTGKSSLQFYMPSASLQLQLPIQKGKFRIVPFGITGVATPIGGAGSMNGQVVGIFGAGLAVQVSSKWDVVGDYEEWVGLPGHQYRFGVLYKF